MLSLFTTITLLAVFNSGGVEARICYQCSQVNSPFSCTTTVQCPDGDECYTERYIDSSLRELYNLGCETRQMCASIEGSDVVVGRKRNEKSSEAVDRDKRATACRRCCFADDCNLSLCLTTVPPTNIPAASEIYVRILGGFNAYEGTVEVYYSGKWGNICDDQWSGSDAKVVCNMLGYTGNGATAKSGGAFPPGQSQIWLDEVVCTGTETSLSQCHHGPWGVTDCSHGEDAGVLCSAVSPEDDVIFLLDTKFRVFARMNLRTQSYALIPMMKLYTPGSFDYDPSQGRIYFIDVGFRQVISMKYDGTDIRIIRQLSTSSYPDNIQVDPLNKVLFYADTNLNTITSMNLDGGNLHNVITTGLDSPRGLALDPRSRTVYWTDWGAQPKIESSNYDGTNRRVIASTNLKWPNSIAIDFEKNMLYFVDGGLGTIEAMDFQGNNRVVIQRDSGAHYFSLDVFGDYLYYTDWTRSTPMRIMKNGTGLSSVGAPSFLELSEIRVDKYGSDFTGLSTPSPLHFDPSHIFVRLSGAGDSTGGRIEIFANGQWGTICDDSWDDNDAKVVCHMMGFDRSKAKATTKSAQGSGTGIISLDEVHCTGTEDHIAQCGISPQMWAVHDCSHGEDAGVLCEPPQSVGTDSFIDNFIVFCDVNTGQLIRMDLNTFSFTYLPIPSSPNPVAITFDPNDQKIYFSEVYNPTSEIRSTGHRGVNFTSLPGIPTASVIDGLAIDKKQNLLFYTDAGNKRVVSISPDGSNMKVVSSNVSQPRGLALDRNAQVIYWTDWGNSPKIEKANYDGSNRQTILSTGLSLPNGIAVDPSAGLIYFCDAGTYTIQVMNTDGTNRRVLFTDYSSHFFGLTITSKYIFYSDWNKLNIMRLNRDGTNQMPAGPDSFSKINGVYAYESGFS